jgi:hypothetical protein
MDRGPATVGPAQWLSPSRKTAHRSHALRGAQNASISVEDCLFIECLKVSHNCNFRLSCKLMVFFWLINNLELRKVHLMWHFAAVTELLPTVSARGKPGKMDDMYGVMRICMSRSYLVSAWPCGVTSSTDSTGNSSILGGKMP